MIKAALEGLLNRLSDFARMLEKPNIDLKNMPLLALSTEINRRALLAQAAADRCPAHDSPSWMHRMHARHHSRNRVKQNNYGTRSRRSTESCQSLIKRVMAKHHLTSSELARKMKVSPSAVRFWGKGFRKPMRHRLHKLNAALKTGKFA